MQDVHPMCGKRSLVAWIGAVAALATLTWTGSAAAAAFLSLQGIAGEAINEQHKDEIVVLSYDLSLVLPRPTDSKIPSARHVCPPVTVIKNLDLASTTLAKRFMQGVHIGRGALALQREGANPLDYFILSMDEILVTEFFQTLAADGRVVEKVTFTARRYNLEYRQTNPTGGQNITKSGWDCSTGEVI